MAQKVLLIVIDQFRADCVSSLLNEAASQGRSDSSSSQKPAALAAAVNMPNLQSLIRESMSFNQHYTVTTPCGPSRASLLTGLYAMNHRSIRNGTPLGAQHQSLGAHMRTVGFEPKLFGYTDASADPRMKHPDDPDLKDYEGLSVGFAEMLRMRLESAGPWVGYLKRKGYDIPDNYWDLFRPVLDPATATPEDPCGSSIVSPARYSAVDSDTAFLTDRTLEGLSACEGSDWFSLVTYIRPHPPLVAPHPFNSLIAPEAVPPARRALSIDELCASHPFFEAYFSEPSNTGLYIGFDGEHRHLSNLHTAQLRAVYLGLAFEVDQHIGRLMDFLRATGQYNDTLIVVTADHGEMLGDQHQWGKTCPLDPALRIPLIIRDPRRPESHGTSTDLFTESVDIAPTLMEWSGGKTAQAFNGHSLLPLLSGETPESWRSHIFSEAELGEPDSATRFQRTFGVRAEQCNFAVLRTQKYKYVHFNGGLPPMLFDLEQDPDENHNLAQKPEFSDILLKMSGMMLDHRMSYAEHSLSRAKLTPQGVFQA